MVKNSAFVFIKPHAVTDKVKELVKKTFDEKNIAIKKDGEILADEIDKKMLVDKHYYAIASKATLLTPDKLPVPKDKFEEKFGLKWDDALKDGKCLNAKDACEKFGIDADALDKRWAECKKAKDLVKFGGGFYCGKLEHEGTAYYVFNGFFMSMRSKFVQEGVQIYYYVVEWESDELSWEDFRGKVLGPTDPAEAPADSLRGAILKNWKDLGLKDEPNTGDNGVHASASPFEALAERMNWLGYRPERDPFGKLVLKAGASPKLVRDWCKDPQVTFGVLPITGSLFDTLEDKDSDWCLAYISMMAGSQPKEKDSGADKEVARLKAELELYKPLVEAVQAIQDFKPAKEASGSGGKGSERGGRRRGKKEEEDEEEEAPPVRKGKGKKKGKGKDKK